MAKAVEFETISITKIIRVSYLVPSTAIYCSHSPLMYGFCVCCGRIYI